jgi:hypothetical protein
MKRNNEIKIKNFEDKISELKAQLKNAENLLKVEKSNLVQPWEEEIIQVCIKNGLSIRSIGSLLKRAPSTIANYSKPRTETITETITVEQPYRRGQLSEVEWRERPRTNGVKKNLVDKVDHRGNSWYFIKEGSLYWHNANGVDKLTADNWEELAGLEPNALFEYLNGRPCNWKDSYERQIYNKLYKLLKPLAGRSKGKKGKKGRRKDKYGNDKVRANVMRKRHNTKGHLTVKRKAEHDILKECPVCFPETSKYANTYRGHDLYIKKIQKMNMEAIDWAVNHPKEPEIENGVKTGVRQIDDKDYRNMSQQEMRYVNKLEHKKEALNKEIENLKKKKRGND